VRLRISADERREGILAAARGLLGSRGLDTIRSAELAEAAGVSEALIFKHFKNKDLLLLEAVKDLLFEQLGRRVSAGKGLSELVDEAFAFAEAQGREGLGHFYRQYFSARAAYPDFKAQSETWMAEYASSIRDAYGPGADAAAAQVEGALLLWSMGYPMELGAVAARLQRTLKELL
jgi:AcrR family transcriptional regulator